jgi:hypothetical protein
LGSERLFESFAASVSPPLGRFREVSRPHEVAVLAEYAFASVALPLGVTREWAREAVAAAMGEPLDSISVVKSDASVAASVHMQVASFDDSVVSNASLSNAFARASNVSAGSVRLLGYGALKRRLLLADVARFNVTLGSPDELDDLWRRYAHGDGNASVARELGALGLNAAGASVVFEDARARVTTRVAARDFSDELLRRATNATTLEVLGALAPRGVSVHLAAATPVAGQSSAERGLDIRALVVFATAPALAFGAYAVCSRGRASSKRRTHALPVNARVRKLIL